VGIVGEGDRFHIIENEEVAAFLSDLGPIERPAGGMEVEDAVAESAAGETAPSAAGDGMVVE
jgi:hypothetical protein